MASLSVTNFNFFPSCSGRLPAGTDKATLLPVGARGHVCAADAGHQRGSVPVRAGRRSAPPGGVPGPRTGDVSVRPQPHGKNYVGLIQKVRESRILAPSGRKPGAVMKTEDHSKSMLISTAAQPADYEVE